METIKGQNYYVMKYRAAKKCLFEIKIGSAAVPSVSTHTKKNKKQKETEKAEFCFLLLLRCICLERWRVMSKEEETTILFYDSSEKR